MARRIAGVIAFIVLAAGIAAGAQTNSKDQARDWTGMLRTGVVAIGGETTGIVLETADGKFEVQGATKAVQAELQKLDKQKVVVHGTLARKPGVEVKERAIITATKVTKTSS